MYLVHRLVRDGTCELTHKKGDCYEVSSEDGKLECVIISVRQFNTLLSLDELRNENSGEIDSNKETAP